jgi:hypothetical protein
MRRARWFLVGAIAMLAILLAAGVFALGHVNGFSAQEPPSALESWLAHRAIRGDSGRGEGSCEPDRSKS